jgi:hypothetical protein
MMTAGHVAAGFGDSNALIPLVGLFGPERRFKCAQVTASEILPGDVAVLKMDYLAAETIHWQPKIRWGSRGLVGLEPIRAIGYAYGIYTTDQDTRIVSRAFEGAVTARLSRFKPLGSDIASFPVYELPFLAPRGLSGCPLLSAKGAILVRGVIIGNSQAKMLVYSSEEIVEEPSGKTRIEHYESLTLGIATDGLFIQQLRSELLGTTIGAHLEAHSLLLHETPSASTL